MKILRTEPSALILDRIYMGHQTRPIVISGHRGELSDGPGGWGNAAIVATFGNIKIVARKREFEDYAPPPREGDVPDRLQVYSWEYEDENSGVIGENIYYALLRDALVRKNGKTWAL